jgi:hypothetical protein
MTRKSSSHHKPESADDTSLAIPMSAKELSIFRDRVNILSIKVVLRTLCAVVVHQSDNNLFNLHHAFGELRKTHERLVVQGLNAASSDMLAAEYQSVMEDLLVFIENGLPDKPPS